MDCIKLLSQLISRMAKHNEGIIQSDIGKWSKWVLLGEMDMLSHRTGTAQVLSRNWFRWHATGNLESYVDKQPPHPQQSLARWWDVFWTSFSNLCGMLVMTAAFVESTSQRQKVALLYLCYQPGAKVNKGTSEPALWVWSRHANLCLIIWQPLFITVKDNRANAKRLLFCWVRPINGKECYLKQWLRLGTEIGCCPYIYA